MGNKCCCEDPEIHVHNYCTYTQVDECHRHKISGVTGPAPNTPGHTHDYEGQSSCNENHSHMYCGCTEKPQYTCCGHVHNFEGKTKTADDHKHRYRGTTDYGRRCRR